MVVPLALVFSIKIRAPPARRSCRAKGRPTTSTPPAEAKTGRSQSAQRRSGGRTPAPQTRKFGSCLHNVACARLSAVAAAAGWGSSPGKRTSRREKDARGGLHNVYRCHTPPAGLGGPGGAGASGAYLPSSPLVLYIGVQMSVPPISGVLVDVVCIIWYWNLRRLSSAMYIRVTNPKYPIPGVRVAGSLTGV